MKDPIFGNQFFQRTTGIYLIPYVQRSYPKIQYIVFFIYHRPNKITNLYLVLFFFSPRSVRRSGAYGVHKNKHCEEWNNLREDTHKTWTFNSFTTPRIIAAIPVFSVVMYSLIKREEEMIDAKAAASGTHENLTMKPAKKVKYL